MASFPVERSFARAACDAAVKAGAQPIDMSYFAAREGVPADYCRERVRGCEVYLGVIGFRYGSVVSSEPDSISYTELEFEEASRTGKPRLLFLLDENAPIPRAMVDVDGRRIEQFRERIKSTGVVSTFSTPDGLEAAVLHALNELRTDRDARAAGPPSDTVAGPRRPWMVPPVGTVVDRVELVDLLAKQLLAPGGGSVSVSTAVEGAGGFGKTTLAAVVCSRDDVRRRYPGGLVWVAVGEDASGAELAGLVNDVCEALTGVRPAASDPMLAGARLGEVLDGRADTLLVLDDVWTVGQLVPFLVGGANSRRLVTTRNRGVVPRGAGSVVVDAMTRAQAAETLQLGIDGLPEASVGRLLGLTGQWPVLLGLVNAAIVDRVADGAVPAQAAHWVAERLAEDGPTALDVTDESIRGRAVASTIAVSLDRLTPVERGLYALLAVFPEDVDIPVDVLTLLWQANRRGRGPETEAVRERLVRLRLVSGRWAEESPAVRLHDVIRDYLRRQQNPRERAAAHRQFLAGARTLIPAGTPTRWWELPASAGYLWRFLPWHLREAGDHDELGGLLEDLRWTAAKTQNLGTAVGVEADLALVDSPVVRSLRRAIAQNAHVLAPLEPGNGLASTLASRLETVPDLAPVVTTFAATLTRPYLHSRWPLPDLPAGSTRRVLSGHRHWVTACSVSPTGTLLASASEDATVRIWRMDTWEPVAVLTGHTGPVRDCTFTPDGTTVVSVGDDRTLRLWDVRSQTQHRVLAGHTAKITACAVTPDGTAVVSASLDGTVRLSDMATGHPKLVLDGHQDGATCCAVSADGRSIATGGNDRTVRLWDTATGSLRDTRTVESPVTDCVFSPDGELLATTTVAGTCSLWSVPSMGRHADLRGHTNRVCACAFSPDGRLLATASHDYTVRTWNTATGKPLTTFAGQPGWVRDCVFSPDGARLLSAGADQIRVSEITGAPTPTDHTGHRGWVRGCAVSPDGRQLATGGDDDIIRLWDTSTGRSTHSLSGHTGDVHGCAYSPDGQLLASAGGDTTVRTWSLSTGQVHRVMKGHAAVVKCCTFSPDGRWVASGSEDKTARIWNPRTGQTQIVLSGHADDVNACAFSPDGQLLATGSADQSIRIWDSGTGRLQTTLFGHEEWVNACVFTRDGRHLITAGGDGTARLWDLQTGTTVLTFRGHARWIRGCALSPDERWIATTGRDRTVRIWDLGTGECVTALRVGARLTTCCWTSTNTIGIAGDAGVYQLALVQAET